MEKENTQIYNNIICFWTKERTELWVKGTSVNFSGDTGEGVPLRTGTKQGAQCGHAYPSQKVGEATGLQTQPF